MKDMETARCFGQMEVCTKENGVKEFNMVLVELFFQMELTKRAISKTTSTNTHFNQEVSKHKWDQQKQVQDSNLTHIVRILINLINWDIQIKKWRDCWALMQNTLRNFHIILNLQKMKKQNQEMFSFLIYRFLKAPIVEQTIQTNYSLKTDQWAKHPLVS